MRRVDLEGIARVITVHAEWRDQYGAVDSDGVHGRDHLIAGNLGRPVKSADPRSTGVVAFVGVNLGIQYRHGFYPLEKTDLTQNSRAIAGLPVSFPARDRWQPRRIARTQLRR
jgi:hypothetical protein